MTACVNCSRALQPAWKYCIFCGTRTAVAATAPRSRPIPKRTVVPGYASVATAQSPLVVAPIVPPAAPAPLSAAPVDEPVSSVWPENLGERPSLRSALAATEVPLPTPPIEDVAPPEDEVAEIEIEPEAVLEDDAEIEDAEETDEIEPEAEPEAVEAPDEVVEPAPAPAPEPEPEPEPEAELRRPRTRRSRSRTTASTAVLEETEEPETDDGLDDEPADRTGSVNTLAVLALLIGILACPLAALFGHLALGQVKASGERGVVPAWIAVVLGYLWLGFWLVFIVSYFATNG